MVRSDDELLQAWRSGEEAAGNELFERYYAAMARFFHNKVDSDADDLIQRTFLACVEGRHRFEGRSSVRTYLFAIANNVLRRHLRTYSRRGHPVDLDTATLFDLVPSASTVLARTREHRALLAALRRVPASVQILLELYYWERLTGPEIAEILGLPVATAKTQIRRGRLQLQEKFDEIVRGGPTAMRTTTDDLERWAEELRAHMRS
jgi:RNA polymerase sigma-70 factor (ECF subfamily)